MACWKELKEPLVTVISPTTKLVVASLAVKLTVIEASFVVDPDETLLAIETVGAVPS